MDREEITQDYMRLQERIAEEYQDRDVPQSVQSYYLLCELLACGSLKDFIRTYGHHPIEPKSASAGKQLLNLGHLSEFEFAVVDIFNESVRHQ